MKKIFYLLLGVLLFIPICIFADMSGPLVREYEFQITNPNGAQLYDFDVDDNDNAVYFKLDGMVPYNYKFTVYDEDGGDDYIYVDDYNGYINRKDGRSLLDKFEISEKNLSKKYDAIVVKDVNIRKGPSDGYDIIGKIKKETKINVRDIVIFDKDTNEYYREEFDPWVYVEYNNIKGYINSYGGYLGFIESEMDAVTAIDVELIDPSTKEIIDVIPANKSLKVTGYSMDIWSGSYYIKYNNKYGIVDDNYFVVKYKNIEFNALEKLNIYENCASIEGDSYNNSVYTSKVIGSISKGTKFNSEYYDTENGYAFIRYEKGNTKGWVCVNADLSDEAKSEYKGIDFEYPDDEETDITDVNEEDEINNPNNEESKVKPVKTNKFTKMEIIYLCIGAAVLVSITAVVTIMLVNKKKKVKNE